MITSSSGQPSEAKEVFNDSNVKKSTSGINYDRSVNLIMKGSVDDLKPFVKELYVTF